MKHDDNDSKKKRALIFIIKKQQQRKLLIDGLIADGINPELYKDDDGKPIRMTKAQHDEYVKVITMKQWGDKKVDRKFGVR